MATEHRVRLTYDDYVRFPADRRWELIDGVAYVVPSPNRRHQDVIIRLAHVAQGYLDEHGGGVLYVAPFDTVLVEGDVVQPDLVFVSDADAGVLTEANIWGTPSWVIEVLSDPYRERLKLDRYQEAGVPEHWLINPYEDTLEVRLLEGGRYAEAIVAGPAQRVSPRCLPSLEVDLGYVLRR